MALKFKPSGQIQAKVGRKFSQRTLAGVVKSLTGKKEAGSADFGFGMSFASSGSKITSVELTVDLEIKMPVWSHYSSASQAERDEWDRFHKALRFHEDGHIKIFKRESPATMDALKAATPSTINDVLGTETARVQAVSDAYDTKTGNGLKQVTPHGTTEITVP